MEDEKKFEETLEESLKETLNEESVETNEKKEKKEKKGFDVKNLSEKEAKRLLKEMLDKNEKLEEEFEKVSKEAIECKESWYRTAADFDNYRKRNSEIRSIAYKDGKIDVITKILVVGDNLDRACKMDLDEKTREGIELTQRQFIETLQSLDVTEINPENEVFSADTMEAIMSVPAEEGEEEGMVKQVFKKGYKLGDKIIRYAQVVVIGK